MDDRGETIRRWLTNIALAAAFGLDVLLKDQPYGHFFIVAFLGISLWSGHLAAKARGRLRDKDADPPRAGLPPMVFLFIVLLLLSLLTFVDRPEG